VVLKNLCVYGGTFDPVHFGHLILANISKEELAVEKFIFLPSFLPPHKKDQNSLSFDQRLKMLELALEGCENFLISDIENQLEGLSYSYLTIEKLKKKYSLTRENFYFLIGGDSLVDFHKWRKPGQILADVQLIVVDRPGSDYSQVDEKIMKQVRFIKAPLIELSSTEIRHRIRTGKSVRFMMPEKVAQYIYANHLYR